MVNYIRYLNNLIIFHERQFPFERFNTSKKLFICLCSVSFVQKPESAEVKVGTLIALMVEEGADWKSVEIPASASAEPPASVASTEPASGPVSVVSAPSGGHVDLHGLTLVTSSFLFDFLELIMRKKC